MILYIVPKYLKNANFCQPNKKNQNFLLKFCSSIVSLSPKRTLSKNKCHNRKWTFFCCVRRNDGGQVPMWLIKKRISALLLLCYCLFFSACSSIPRVPISFLVQSQVNINSDGHLQALPVRLRIYQLSDISQFKEATFKALWKMDKAVLANSLISVKEITVLPSMKESITLTRAEGANYIGVIALFRKVKTAQWRAYSKIDSQAKSLIASMKISVSGNKVRLK